jgi:hypothetical protein
VFGENIFLKQYPYFLPCAISATFSLIALLVTFFSLKETLLAPISIGQLLNFITENKQPTLPNCIGPSAAMMPRQSTRTQILDDDCRQTERPLPLRSLLTPRVLIAAGNYASLSLVDIAFRAIQPVFLSTPIPLGGLGLPPSSIGTLLSIQGILSGIFQVFFFAPIQERWGSKKTFIAAISTAIPAFIMFPVANAFAQSQGYGIAVWIAFILHTNAAILLSLAYGQCNL